jgi:hypothetical protein
MTAPAPKRQPYAVPHRGPRWLLAVAVVTIVAAIAIVYFRPNLHPELGPANRREAPVGESGFRPSVGSLSVGGIDTPDVASEGTASEVSTVAAPTRLRLVARLALDPAEDFLPTSVRVATLAVDPSDRADFLAQRASGGQGAGPRSIEELANPSQWLEPVVTNEPGAAHVVVEECPAAFGYRVIAWQEDGRYFVSSLFPRQPPEDGTINFGTIEGTPPTGVILRFENNLHGETELLVRIIRQPSEATAEVDSQPLAILRHIDPALHETLSNGDWIPLSASSATRLAPLASDPAILVQVSTLAGIEGKAPVPAELAKGRITPVTINIGDLFPEAVSTVDVQGRLLFGASEVPVEGASLSLPGLPASQQQVTGPDGRFEFLAVPRGAVTAVEVLLPRPASGRPLAREATELTIGPFPDEDFPDSIVEQDLRIESYRWLLAEIPADVREAFAKRAKFPFPIYTLQHWPGDDNWVDLPSDEFLVEENGTRLAVALAEGQQGVLRISAAVSPLETLITTVADVQPEDFETEVAFTLAGDLPTRTIEVRLLNVATNAPITHAEILLLGDHSSMPPTRAESDGSGIVSIGFTNARRLVLYVRHPQLGEGEIVLALTEDVSATIDAHVTLVKE